MHLHFTWKDMIHFTRKLWAWLVWVALVIIIAYTTFGSIKETKQLYSKNGELEQTLKQVREFQRQMQIEQMISKRLPASLSVGDHLLVVKGVYAASKTYDIPIDVILAIIEVESRFQKNAVSPVGAKGLMQVMSGTAKLMNTRYGISMDLDDPYNNIQVGTCLLRHLINHYTAKKVPPAALWVYVLHGYATGQDGDNTSYFNLVEKAK